MIAAWLTLLEVARRRIAPVPSVALAAIILSWCTADASAQEGQYVPFDQNAPVGRIGQWSAEIGKGISGVLQPVRIKLPSAGKITVYNGGPANAYELVNPGQFNVGVGFAYRLRIAEMPDYPGVELYPTIEILDRLHPPRGREQEFPIPIDFTADEIQTAIDGRMMTKVVYLEQPQLAVTGDLSQAILARQLPPDRNLLIEADRVGRPMVLVRLGGRVPDLSKPDDGFFLPPAPLQMLPERPATVPANQVRRSQPHPRNPEIQHAEADETTARGDRPTDQTDGLVQGIPTHP